MKNQRGIVWAPVLIMIGVVMVTAVAAYLLIRAGNTKQTGNSNTNVAGVNLGNIQQLNLQPINTQCANNKFDSAFIDKNVPDGSVQTEINITDASDPFVAESKNALIAVVGQDYFNTHYSFVCAVQNVPQAKIQASVEYPMVRWQYSVGPYITSIEDNLITRNGVTTHAVTVNPTFVPKTLQSNDVISEQMASNKIRNTIGAFVDAKVQFKNTPDQLTLTARSATASTDQVRGTSRGIILDLRTGAITTTQLCSDTFGGWSECPKPL